jgi:uncharacterized protein
MEAPMDQEIHKLIQAQDIDLEIDKLIQLKKDYPNQIDQLNQEIASLEQSLAKAVQQIRQSEVNRNTIETEIDGERERLASREQRLLDTKTNKEYTAVQHEIVQSRERIDSLETEDIELMNKLDQLNPQKEELDKKLAETRQANNEKSASMKDRFDSIESDIAKLEIKRNHHLQEVSSRTLAVYQRLRKGKSGLAIVMVDQSRNSCRGCFKQLPHQKVLELKRGDKLMFCENCGRILVWDHHA